MVVLLVDDDVRVRSFLLVLLQADGFTVLPAGAGDGEAALEASRTYSDPVDLLLTDLEMPRLGGLELCQKIRAERHEIKVLVMSGDPRWKEQAALNGLPFLQKPFTHSALRDAVETLLGSASGGVVASTGASTTPVL